jgi:hypothetical protein
MYMQKSAVQRCDPQAAIAIAQKTPDIDASPLLSDIILNCSAGAEIRGLVGRIPAI